MTQQDNTGQNEQLTQLALENFLPYRLSILSNTVSGTIASAYDQRFDLTIPEWRVMAVIGRRPGLSAAEVAERTLMDKVAVSRAVAKLLKAERITREFADADKRRSILELSPTGREVYEQVAPLALQMEADLLKGFTEEEINTLNLLLDRMLARTRLLGAPHI
ncbi:MAG: MarR family winged helix-turn-helix transcriptional regulator [Woeseiaceae bacterium]